jgi:hypothetical protein
VNISVAKLADKIVTLPQPEKEATNNRTINCQGKCVWNPVAIEKDRDLNCRRLMKESYLENNRRQNAQ